MSTNGHVVTPKAVEIEGSNRRRQNGITSEKVRLDLQRTRLGSHVVCEDRQLIFEEAPEAYKDIRAVITDLEQARLVRVIARLRPLLSYKTRGSGLRSSCI